MTCKDTYEAHLYILLDWENMPDTTGCNRFIPMNNLELLEWEYQMSLINVPTRNNLR
jgi:hypothetical protein